MFLLSEMRSVVRLEAKDFDKELTEALSDCLNNKLANKILKDVGLVIGLWDILSVGDSFIMAGNDGSHTKVNFRLLVFRPFMDEVLVGKIKSCTREGVHLSLGFFDDILIPPEALQHPHRFDETDQVWVWEYPTEPDEDGNPGESHDLFMDPGEEIRFRVTSETFVDCSPNAPDPAAAAGASGGRAAAAAGAAKPGDPNVKPDPDATGGGGTGTEETPDKRIPFQLQASINEPGLGLLSWWKTDS